MNRDLIFAIHDLNQKGGQDRSTLEIVEHLGKEHSVAVHAYTYESSVAREKVRFRPLRAIVLRPAFLKFVHYHFVTGLRFWRLKRRNPSALICATGACSLLSDVVHVQFVHASWQKKMPRTFSPYRIGLHFYNLLTERIAFRPHKTYIAISEAVKRDLECEYGLSKVKVVHHGVNPERFRPAASPEEKRSLRARLGLPNQEEVILLYVGTFERKGLAQTIAALAQVPPAQRARMRLVAIGAGDHAKFRSLAAKHGVENQVHLLGPRTGIEEYFRAADAFVFPTTYEPFGLVILEAMASGLACVASTLAGGTELMRDGESGLHLSDPNNVAELSALIAKLGNDEIRSNLGARARAVAETRSWNKVAEEYRSAIDS